MTKEALSISRLARLQAEAEKARSASAPAEAIELYSRALELAAASPEGLAGEQEFALRSGRAACYNEVANYTAEAEDLAVILRIAREKGDLHRQVDVLNRRVLLLENSGELETGRQLAEETLALALAAGDRKMEADSRYAQGIISEYLGDFVQADSAAEQAWAIYHRQADRRSPRRPDLGAELAGSRFDLCFPPLSRPRRLKSQRVCVCSS